MLEKLRSAKKLTGVRQVGRALRSGKVLSVYLAEDAEPKITEPIEHLCREHSVPLEKVESMAILGEYCNISVGSAVAAIVE